MPSTKRRSQYGDRLSLSYPIVLSHNTSDFRNSRISVRLLHVAISLSYTGSLRKYYTWYPWLNFFGSAYRSAVRHPYERAHYLATIGSPRLVLRRLDRCNRYKINAVCDYWKVITAQCGVGLIQSCQLFFPVIVISWTISSFMLFNLRLFFTVPVTS